jgi:hypothetical protein
MGYLGTKPANQVIDSTLIADGTITPSDLSTGKPVWDTSGNVGIGTSSPSGKLHVNAGANYGSVYFQAVNGTDLKFVSGSTQVATIASDSSSGASPVLLFRTGSSDTERMRVDSSGNLLVGTTTASNSCRAVIKGGNGTQLTLDNAGEQYTQLYFNNNGSAKADMYFENSTTRLYVRSNNSGGVYLSSGGTSWTSASDERVKDIIEPITNGAEKVSSLRAVIGKYKTDEDGTRRAFLIAQDVQAVLPEAVDATDPEQLGVAYSDVIPLLVSAIQEQQAIITELKTRIEALEQA